MNVYSVTRSIDKGGSRHGLPTILVSFAGCNMRCEYCREGYRPGDSSREHKVLDKSFVGPKAVADAIIAVASEDGINNLTFSGGEPMMYESQMIDILEQLSLTTYRFAVNVRTNNSIDVRMFSDVYKDTIFSKLNDNSLMFTFSIKTSAAGEYEKDICVDLSKSIPRCFVAIDCISRNSHEIRNSIVVEASTIEDLDYAASLYRQNTGIAAQFDWYVAPKWSTGPGTLAQFIEYLNNNLDLRCWRLQI